MSQKRKRIYRITTYEEWKKFTNIREIIITNKKGKGYIRFEGKPWRILHDNTRPNFDPSYMEDLPGFIKNIQPNVLKMVKPNDVLLTIASFRDATENKEENEFAFMDVEYDTKKICKDVITKCYVKIFETYNLKFHEYLVLIFSNGRKYNDSSAYKCFIFDSLNITFTPVDELTDKHILWDPFNLNGYCHSQPMMYANNIDNIDTAVVDPILDSLIIHEKKLQFKKLLHNLIVNQEEKPIIFHDFNECLCAIWTRYLLYAISSARLVVDSCDYYDDKKEFLKNFKIQKPRCVSINTYSNIPIKTQIDAFCKLGIKNIIVCQRDKTNDMYNILNFRKYLNDNEEPLLKLIKEQNNYEPTGDWKTEIRYDNNIFYKPELLMSNLLKWGCM